MEREPRETGGGCLTERRGLGGSNNKKEAKAHALSAGPARRWKVSLGAQITCQRGRWPGSSLPPLPLLQSGRSQLSCANRCSRGQVEVPLSGFEAVPPSPDTEFVASSWLLEVSLLCWLPRRLPTPLPQLLAGRRTACAGHVLVPGAWGEPGAEGDSKGGSEGAITVQPGRGLGTAVRVPTRAESQRAGPLHAGQAVCCLPGAVR